MRGACWALAWMVALGCVAWAFGALHFDFPICQSAAAWTFVIIVLAVVVFLRGAWRKLGAIETGGLAFAELKKRALIDAAAKAAGNSPDFSRLIREGRPGFPSPSRSTDETKH